MSEHHAQRASFAQAPCQCVRRHSPKPLVVELHHFHPQAEQRKVWGRVLDLEVVALCGSGHDNVHRVLTALLAGAEPPATSSYLRGIAAAGHRRILAARAGAKPGDATYKGEGPS